MIFSKGFKLVLIGSIVCSCMIMNSCSRTTVIGDQEIETEGLGTESGIALSEYLKRKPGVMVRGHGLNATVTVRGINSLTSSNEPLFVVNGQQVLGGFTDVAGMVSVGDIKTLRVLTDSNDLAIYGVRGANGVIEITLKN